MSTKEYVSLPNGLRLTDIDCVYNVNVVSEEFEKKARKIFVLTKDMELDLTNEEFYKTITRNYEEGKYYTYVLPNSAKSKRYEEEYKDRYISYLDMFNFIFIPMNTFDLLQEIVVYDPPEKIDDDSKIDGFMLVTTANESPLYIKLSYNLLRVYMESINSYKDIEKIPLVKQKVIRYRKDVEALGNKQFAEILNKIFKNPLSLKKEREQLLAHIRNSTLEKGLKKDMEEDFGVIFD